MDKSDFYFLPIPNWDNIKDAELLDLSLVINAINSLNPSKTLTLNLIEYLDATRRLGFEITSKTSLEPVKLSGIDVGINIPRVIYKISKINAINLKVFASSPHPELDDFGTPSLAKPETSKTEHPIIEKSVSPKERNSMLLVILGMAIDKYGYDPASDRNPATGSNKNSIKASLEKIGIPISNDTLKKYLEEAIQIQQLKK